MEEVVVGGRTTGLMMAVELARRGIAVRIIDKSPGREALSEDVSAVASAIFEGYGRWIDVLVVATGEAEPAVRLRPEVSVIGDPEHSMHDRYEAHSPCLYLIRPDGYVGYRSLRIDSVEEYLDSTIR